MSEKKEKLVLELPLGIDDIRRIIPHRYPFLFVDKITEFDDSVRIVGIKNVSANEPYFQGHFPNKPIMPGVIILEALAQMGAIFAKLSSGGVGDGKLIVFAGAESVRFRKLVFPGDVLSMEISSHRRRGTLWRVEAKASVGDSVVTEATLLAWELDENGQQ